MSEIERKKARRKIIEKATTEERERLRKQTQVLGGLVDSGYAFHDALDGLRQSAENYMGAAHVTQKQVAELLGLSDREKRLVFQKDQAPAATPVDSTVSDQGSWSPEDGTADQR